MTHQPCKGPCCDPNTRKAEQAQQLADLVLIYFTKEELHPDEAAETKAEMLTLAKEIERWD